MSTKTAFRLHSANQFALCLRALRRSQGLTQRELGQRIGVTGARISEIEKDPGGVGLNQILKLLHVLGARAVIELHEGSSTSETGSSATRGEW